MPNEQLLPFEKPFMKYINEHNRKPGAVLAFMLVPLSGLATDMYLPSFPEMTHVFHTTDAAIQMTLAVFLISYGIGQFIAGTFLDSFGRYRPTLLALAVFIFSNFLIITSRNIYWIYVYRSLQGLCVSFIAVGKRTYFVDAYKGKQQKSFTALTTIIWSVAPISAPFIGGFLEKHFSWNANFYFLGFYTLLLLILEILFSGETLKEKAIFKLKPIVQTYRKLLNTRDFTVGVVFLGISFCMVMSFNMSIPFIIEKKFHLSPVVTGYCALCSGTSILIGGLIGRKLSINSLFKKLWLISLLQLIGIISMLASTPYLNDIYLLMIFVIFIHGIEGLVYNLFFTHCLTRFPEHAATAGGITGGGSYIVLSAVISVIMSIISVNNQEMLAVCYIILSLLGITVLLLFKRSIIGANMRMMVVERREARLTTASMRLH